MDSGTLSVESFRLDHTRIEAPYVRLSKRMEVPGSDYEVSVFDFRVRTPNREPLSPRAAHSLEHLFAVALRAEFEENHRRSKVIDVSPMGCRTGFYLSILAPRNHLTLEKMTEAVLGMLTRALLCEELPGASVESCGAYKEHDLSGARSEIQRLMDEDIAALENPPLLEG